MERETLILAIISGIKSCRHCFMREVGIGSYMQLLVGDPTVSSQISLSVTGSKRGSMGPSYTAKVGDSHERESKTSRKLRILLENKPQRRCGSSERGTSDGRDVVRDLPNSSICLTETEKNCRLDHMESILLQ